MKSLNDWKSDLDAGHFLEIAGGRFHYARMGRGPTVLLLHGWPEFWLTWRKNIPELAKHFDVIVPDLRGFGESRSTDRSEDAPLTPDILADDLVALMGALEIPKAGFVGHDVGAQAAQTLARKRPDMLTGLFTFNCPYPGIGHRWADADSLPETWYQYFNQLPLAAELAGHNRDTCRLYFGHILSHWSHDRNIFDDDLDLWVDNFMSPGALEGGFSWYRGVDELRRAIIRSGPPDLPKIPHPTRVFWGEHDPILRVQWMDGLSETFADLRADIAKDAGHFVHYETPEVANREIIDFFDGLSMS